MGLVWIFLISVSIALPICYFDMWYKDILLNRKDHIGFLIVFVISLSPWLCISFGEWKVLRERTETPVYVDFIDGHAFNGDRNNVLGKFWPETVTFESMFNKKYSGQDVKVTHWQLELGIIKLFPHAEHTIVEKEE